VRRGSALYLRVCIRNRAQCRNVVPNLFSPLFPPAEWQNTGKGRRGEEKRGEERRRRRDEEESGATRRRGSTRFRDDGFDLRESRPREHNYARACIRRTEASDRFESIPRYPRLSNRANVSRFAFESRADALECRASAYSAYSAEKRRAAMQMNSERRGRGEGGAIGREIDASRSPLEPGVS